jgi:uncharacterized protein YcgI (DUF1989 family)
MCETLGTILHLTGRQLRLIERAAPGGPVADFIDAAYDAVPTGGSAEPGRVPSPLPDGAQEVAPGAGVAVELARGDVLRVEQLWGGACVDLVAWSLHDHGERLSAARTRTVCGVSPGLGDVLWSGPPAERPIAVVVADSAPGHDLLYPACSPREYARAGVDPDPSCHGVQAEAAAAYGIAACDLPDPFNLWLRGSVGADNQLDWASTPTRPGDHVELLALIDLLVIVNPCVDDVFGCSGFNPRPIAVLAQPASDAVRNAWLAAAQGHLGPRPSQAVTWHRIEVASDGPADALRAAAVRLAVERLEAQSTGGR